MARVWSVNHSFIRHPWKLHIITRTVKNFRTKDMYTTGNECKSTVRWEFSSRALFCCKGAATTDIEIQRVIDTNCPTHDPNPDSRS